MTRLAWKLALIGTCLPPLATGSPSLAQQGYGRPPYANDPYSDYGVPGVGPRGPFGQVPRIAPSVPVPAHDPWGGRPSYRPGDPGGYPTAGYPVGPYRLAGLSGQLVAEVDAFLVGFTPTARIVPQGERMLGDARRLFDAAIAFDQAVRQGRDLGRLNTLAREIDRHASRLTDRVDRVARGRIGPNIAQVYRIGALAADLRLAFDVTRDRGRW